MQQRLELEHSVQELLLTVKFNFNQLESQQIENSPEERIERQTFILHTEMVKCRNLDYFYDVVFELDGKHMMRANSVVLNARSEYFKIMFDAKYGFRESNQCPPMTKIDKSRHSSVRYVAVKGIPKEYFTAILQFLYTDNFCQTESTLAFFLRLMLYADYFMINRMSELC